MLEFHTVWDTGKRCATAPSDTIRVHLLTATEHPTDGTFELECDIDDPGEKLMDATVVRPPASTLSKLPSDAPRVKHAVTEKKVTLAYPTPDGSDSGVDAPSGDESSGVASDGTDVPDRPDVKAGAGGKKAGKRERQGR